MEPVEDGVPLLLGDAGTRVVDSKVDSIAPVTDAHLDLAAFAGELARVVDEDPCQSVDEVRSAPAP